MAAHNICTYTAVLCLEKQSLGRDRMKMCKVSGWRYANDLINQPLDTTILSRTTAFSEIGAVIPSAHSSKCSLTNKIIPYNWVKLKIQSSYH